MKLSLQACLLFMLVLGGLGGCTSIPSRSTTGSSDTSASLPINGDDSRATQTGLSAVDKLIQQGNSLRQQGDFVQAAAILERALRLSPNRGEGFLALANVKLDQGMASQALQLAQKALSLAAGNKSLQRAAWLLIGQVKNQQGDWRGGRQAEDRARQF